MQKKEYTEENIIGFSEAYDLYELFDKEQRKNIPVKFVESMKNIPEMNIGEK